MFFLIHTQEPLARPVLQEAFSIDIHGREAQKEYKWSVSNLKYINVNMFCTIEKPVLRRGEAYDSGCAGCRKQNFSCTLGQDTADS